MPSTILIRAARKRVVEWERNPQWPRWQPCEASGNRLSRRPVLGPSIGLRRVRRVHWEAPELQPIRKPSVKPAGAGVRWRIGWPKRRRGESQSRPPPGGQAGVATSVLGMAHSANGGRPGRAGYRAGSNRSDGLAPIRLLDIGMTFLVAVVPVASSACSGSAGGRGTGRQRRRHNNGLEELGLAGAGLPMRRLPVHCCY